MQLEQYLKYFPMKQILIISTEELKKNTEKTMRRIFKFLGADEMFTSPKFSIKKNISKQKRRKNKFGMFIKWLSKKRMARIFSEDFRYNAGIIIYKPFSKKIKKPDLKEELKQKLTDYLKDDIAKFREVTGTKFEEWSV